jgi:iron complex outermembrane receptor protein
VNYRFFNPKIGFSYVHKNYIVYSVFAQGNREPVRDDFRNNKPSQWPKNEALNNIELGLKYAKNRSQLHINFYSMDYTNQLVLTGAVNDVGEAIRTNVESSYRRGVEIEGQFPLSKKSQVGGNLTLSKNKIDKFTEYVGEWTSPYTTREQVYTHTDISFSPNAIAAMYFSFQIHPSFTITSQNKYVSKQYLDNTQHNDRSLPAFFTSDWSLDYQNQEIKGLQKLTVGIYLNNIFNSYYSPNGYTFSGFIDNQRQDFNYIYPMAGFNWMVKMGVTL